MNGPLHTTRMATAPDLSTAQSLRLNLLRLSQDDAPMATMLREMLWQAYCDANQPYGATEDGMFVWWAHEGTARRQ